MVRALGLSSIWLTAFSCSTEIMKVSMYKQGGFTTWINKKIRSAVLGKADLEDRVKKLEKAVFKMTAL